MATTNPASMGRRIADARERAGLTQAVLAEAAAVDGPTLTEIENGTRRVSAIELGRIADALDERIEWFVMEAPPALLSYRDMREPGATSSTIDRVVERVARNVEFVLRNDDTWNLPQPPEMGRPRNAQEAESRAARARLLLGLDEVTPFLDMPARLSGIGLLAFSLELGSDSADAASILLTQGGVAVVNGHLHVGRRRLALAHELGHYLFADACSVDWRIAEQNDDTAWESRLDRFARALLLPAAELGRKWTELRERNTDQRTAAVKIGSAFRVDMSTLARRLWELGHISQGEAHHIRSVRTTRADIVELNLVVHPEFAAPSLTREYEEAVLRLYRNEVISSARAIDLLFDTWEEAELPSLPRLPESAIWKFVS